jgi:hypothetical protein
MTNQRACANAPALSRRTFMTLAPVAVMATPLLAEGVTPTSSDLPFLSPIAGQPDMLALCYPMDRINHAYCYMLKDGRTIYADLGRWCDGSAEGWRQMKPGEFDGRVIGRVISVHVRSASGWHQSSSVYLAG